jgi:two-component system chemotaxis response regulator CheY
MTDCRVLIVEDDADTREALAAALSDAGFLVEQAGDGAQALARSSAGKRIDVILLDVHLPDMKAAELSELLCKGPAGAGARVLLLTGDARTRLLDCIGAAKLLHKPISLEDLENAVKEACAAPPTDQAPSPHQPAP